MTSDEWFAATDPAQLLAFVNPSPVWVEGRWVNPPPVPSAIVRRLLLFGCACARTVWHLLSTDSRSAVLVHERYAEGRATSADLHATHIGARYGALTIRLHTNNAASLDPDFASRGAAYTLASHAASNRTPGRAGHPQWGAAWDLALAAARATQAQILRDIFPPPGYMPYLEPELLTSTVIAMARQMDEKGDFSAVPILADALQDAGCDTETVLQCCRAPGNVHVRGNWVVDLVLASSKVTVP